MTEPMFHCLSWLGQMLLLLAMESLMSVFTAGLWGWALMPLQTGVAFCFSLILLCPSVVVELLLLDMGMAVACVSVVLNYFVLFVWDLHVNLAPGWVWPCLGLVQLFLGLIFCITIIVDRVSPFGILLGMVVPVLHQYLGIPLLPQLVFFLMIPVLILLTLDYICFMKNHSYWYNHDRFNLMLLLEVWSSYWIVRVLAKALILLHGLQGEGCSWAALSNVLSTLLVSSSESVIAVLGMNAVIAFVAMSLEKHLYSNMLYFNIPPTPSPVDVYGVFVKELSVLWILGLQFGLWDLEPTQRLERLLQNMYLLLVLGLAGVHCSVHVVLLGLGQSQHLLVPALVVSGLMLYFPVHVMLVFWQLYDWDVWLLTATAFSLLLVLKVLVSVWFWVCRHLTPERHTWLSYTSVMVTLQMEMVLGALMVAMRVYSLLQSRRIRHLLLLLLHLYTHTLIPGVIRSHLDKDFVAGRVLRLPMVFLLNIWGPVCAEAYEDLSPQNLSAQRLLHLPQSLRSRAPRGRGGGRHTGGGYMREDRMGMGREGEG
uniref:TRC8-like N-terminal domain-containing protein n=1 Tax=Knipowitschia caucasica TaxID=637954 RepID=A0AAV2M1S2_KNICA